MPQILKIQLFLVKIIKISLKSKVFYMHNFIFNE